MRVVTTAFLILGLTVPVVWAANRPAAGSLSIEGGRGTVVVRGAGTVVGRVAKGDLQIVDLSPNDQWSPRVNGVEPIRAITRGKDLNFYIPGGRYRITVRGDGISVSARGAGFAIVKGKDTIDNGTIAIGDATPSPLPIESQRVTFGGGADGPSAKALP